jgi:hypothetical protein
MNRAPPLPTPDDVFLRSVADEFANRKNIHCTSMVDFVADRLANLSI